MIQRFIDDLKDSTGNAVRSSSLMAAMAAMLFIALSFGVAAIFVYVLQTEGLIYACLAGAAIFVIAALLAAGAYVYQKRQAEARAAEAAKSTAHSVLSDPMVMAVGLQVVRAIGIKRLIPILAVGGLALGFLAARRSDETDEAEPVA
jgi:uncharacterized membrane protein YqjE